ncbi:hypothetical protein HAX54_024484, partial [Datura stramonium]|nr:hypothetical protein [Datura stramonium]
DRCSGGIPLHRDCGSDRSPTVMNLGNNCRNRRSDTLVAVARPLQQTTELEVGFKWEF